MERFFTPVHGSSEDEAKIHKHYQPIPHRNPHNYHYHQNQYHHLGSHSHSSSSSHEKHSDSHDHHHNDNRHHSYHHKYPKVAGAHHGFTKTSSSSLSSSSGPTSSASWTSEPSLDDETYLTYNKPQHSLSCSNISEVQRKIIEDFDYDHRDPSQRQRHSLEHSDQLLPSSQHGHRAPKLCRGHSKSEEGLQHRDSEASHTMEHGALYKTASLGHSLALGENSLGGTSKRAVSSIQLPSKGILKNKDEGQNGGNFRKSKSMEVISTRVQVTKTSKQSSTKVARQNVVKGKLQFSAFLDEITRQVICPSTLSSLGLASPKSPNEERKHYADKLKKERAVTSPKQQPERPDSGKTATDSSTCSQSHKKARQHQNHYHETNFTGPTPPPRHPSKAERRGATSEKQHHRQYSQLLTDGTSTSPEPIPKHKERQSGHNPGRQLHRQEHSSSLPPLQTLGSSASASSEKSGKSKHTGHRRHSRTYRDSASAVDTVQLLEDYNEELHENLLQMVSCIENMEAELQSTKIELATFKEKYKRLQESYSASQQSNSVLEQKIKSTVDSLDSERKFLLQRVGDMTNQLEASQKTINSLENINVPSLIRELLKKPFDSKEELENFSYPQTFPTQSVTVQSNRSQEFKDKQSSIGKGEASVFEWPGTGQKCSNSSKQPATAFSPWKHDHDPWAVPDPREVKGSDSQLPFSVTDDVPIYKAMADATSSSHQVHQFGKNTEFHSVAMPTRSCADVPLNPCNLNEMRHSRETGGDLRDSVTVRKDNNDFNYLTAQRMLEEFLSQIPPPTHDGKEKEAREQAEGNQ